jgi:hypothetical protein
VLTGVEVGDHPPVGASPARLHVAHVQVHRRRVWVVWVQDHLQCDPSGPMSTQPRPTNNWPRQRLEKRRWHPPTARWRSPRGTCSVTSFSGPALKNVGKSQSVQSSGPDNYVTEEVLGLVAVVHGGDVDARAVEQARALELVPRAAAVAAPITQPRHRLEPSPRVLLRRAQESPGGVSPPPVRHACWGNRPEPVHSRHPTWSGSPSAPRSGPGVVSPLRAPPLGPALPPPRPLPPHHHHTSQRGAAAAAAGCHHHRGGCCPPALGQAPAPARARARLS